MNKHIGDGITPSDAVNKGLIKKIIRLTKVKTVSLLQLCLKCGHNSKNRIISIIKIDL